MLAAILIVMGCESSISPRDATGNTPIQRITINIKESGLVVGQEVQLRVVGPTTSAVWQSDNPMVVAVSSDGLVSAEAPGKARVIVRAATGTDTAFITVRPVIASIEFTMDSVDLSIGETAHIPFRALDREGNPVDMVGSFQIRWNSDSPSVTAVDTAGLISALDLGTSRVALEVDGVSAAATVRVVPSHVASIALSVPTQFGLSVGAVYELKASPKDGAGNELPNRPITWSSSDGTVAAVSSSGKVTALAAGSAVVSASTDGQQASTTVVVTQAAATTVTVALNATNLAPGQTTQATAVVRDAAGNQLAGTMVAWSSLNPSTATVSPSGLVTAIATGPATIRASFETKVGDAGLTVTAPVSATTSSVVVTVDSSTIAPGHTAQGRVVARDAQNNVLTGRTASWSSKNMAIATVDRTTGIVTAVSAGTVVIQAAVDGVMGQASINVNVPIIITAPTPTSGTLFSHDFEDGTLGGYYNPWGTGIDVVDDPTGGGRGKVARIRYYADGVTQYDDNRALFPKTAFALGLGDSLWFRGDFYLPSTLNDDPSASMRKLVKWGFLHDGSHFPEQYEMTLTLAGAEVQVTNTVVGPSNLAPDYTYTGFDISKGQWHRLEIQLKLNTSFAAQDGILRLWVDGKQIYNRTNMRWTDPLWTEDPNTYNWQGWGVSDQMQAKVAYDEYRYWDNVIYSKSRVP